MKLPVPCVILLLMKNWAQAVDPTLVDHKLCYVTFIEFCMIWLSFLQIIEPHQNSRGYSNTANSAQRANCRIRWTDTRTDIHMNIGHTVPKISKKVNNNHSFWQAEEKIHLVLKESWKPYKNIVFQSTSLSPVSTFTFDFDDNFLPLSPYCMLRTPNYAFSSSRLLRLVGFNR